MLSMDEHDLEHREMQRSISHLSSSEQKHLQGRTSILSDCFAPPEEIAGYEKQWQESNNEIKSCKAANLSKMLNYGSSSSTDCTKQDEGDLRQLSSLVSTASDYISMNENCMEGTVSVISPHKVLNSEGNSKDGAVSSHTSQQMNSIRNTTMKIDASSETGKALNMQYNGLMGHWLNTGEDVLNSMLRDPYHSRQLKTESSSSNSTHIILPASSNDSYQDAKLSKCFQSTGTDASMCSDSKFNLREPAAKGSASNLAIHISPADVSLTASSPGKQGIFNSKSDVINVLASCDKLAGIIANLKSVAAKDEILKPGMPAFGNANIANQDKVESCYELDDALAVARRVAREVAQEVCAGRDASRNSSSMLESSEVVHLNSADSAVPYKESRVVESRCEVTSCSEQDNSDSFCSRKEVFDQELSMAKKQLYLDVVEPSHESGSTMISPEVNHRKDLSYVTANTKARVLADQTTHSSGFDLNANVVADEAECSKQSIKEAAYNQVNNVSKPTPVMAKYGIPICLPLTHLQSEDLVGWMGPAATSAFRPASFSGSSNRIKVSSTNPDNCSKDSRLRGIDLNMAVAGVDSDMELLPEKCIPASSFHFKVSSLEVCSTGAESSNIDLNCANENDNDCGQIYTQTSSASLLVRDFDLNDNPTSEHAYGVACKPDQANLTLRKCRVDGPGVSFVGNAKQQEPNNIGLPYWANPNHPNPVQVFSHGLARPFLMAVPGMLPTMGQMPKVVSLEEKSSCRPASSSQPPYAFPYSNGFCTDPINYIPSPLYPPGVVPYMTDPKGPTLFLPVIGSSNLPAFSGALQVTQIPGEPGPSSRSVARSDFNLKRGVTPENGTGAETYGQRIFAVSNLVMEEQMKSFQPLALTATTQKRREPEGGWDSHQHGYRQVTSWR